MKKKKKNEKLKYGCRTDVGRVRDHNEDNLLAKSPLFAVADGMGGHAAGEVASKIAINSLLENAPESADVEELARAVEIANGDIIRAVMDGRGKQGMGTTMTAAIVEGEKIAIAQVGDSRAYLLHNGKLQQITRDHSLMADLIEQGQITPAEARVHPNRSLITRALGSDPHMYADQYEIDVKSGDRLLLCSDGLCGMLTDGIIEGFMRETKDPQQCADKLVEQANAHGGLDNITVIVVDIAGNIEVVKKKIAIKTKLFISFIIFLLILILCGSIGLGIYLVNNSAYLIEEDGYVCVYKGVPDKIAGFSFSEKVYQSDVLVSDLRASTQDHFNQGAIKVSDLDAADEIIQNYKQEAKDLQSSKSNNIKDASADQSALSNSDVNSNNVSNQH